jgi:hypothetical protein
MPVTRLLALGSDDEFDKTTKSQRIPWDSLGKSGRGMRALPCIPMMHAATKRHNCNFPSSSLL